MKLSAKKGVLYSIYFPQGRVVGMRLVLCLGVRKGFVSLYLPQSLQLLVLTPGQWTELVHIRPVQDEAMKTRLCKSMQDRTALYRTHKMRFSEANYKRAQRVLKCTETT